MEIKPRYDGPPAIEMDGTVADIREATLRQRRRFVKALQGLTPEQWEAASRCEGWRVQDVVTHLTTTNQFWAMSMTAGAAGNPTRFLVGFDPKASPASLVAGRRGDSAETTLAQHVVSVDAVCAAIGNLDDAGWNALAEAPVGHIPNRLVAHHALWDSWIHERDVLLPLGITPAEEPDEILASLRYVAALSPAFALSGDPTRTGAIVFQASAPDATVVVDIHDGAVHIRNGDAPAGTPTVPGRAVDLAEAISQRAKLAHDFDADHRWLVAGLADVFETA